MLRGLARFELGGSEYVLRTLPIEDNETWLTRIDAQLSGLLSGLEGDDVDMGGILSMLAVQVTDLVLVLADYDRENVLGGVAAIRKVGRPHEILLAVVAVWRAANPLVDIALAGMAASVTAGMSSDPTSSSPPSTDGASQTSDDGSLPSSSSGISMLRQIVDGSSSTPRSKRSAPERSSPTTRRRTPAGPPVPPSVASQ